MNAGIPSPVSGGLILSYKCNASCRHCMYACNSRWKADWIREENLQKMLAQLAGKIQPAPGGPESIGLSHGLHFTGGEPFLNFELLCRATEIASEMGIPSLFVETNCVWSVNDEITREKLHILKERGLKGIMISVNPFYLEFVPFERTERAIRCALEVFGYNTFVYQVEYYRQFLEMGIRDTMPYDSYLELEKRTGSAMNTEFFMMGRAPFSLTGNLEGTFPRFPAGRLSGQSCSPEFLRSWHNHFDNYGNYMPGFCGGISLGDTRHLDEILECGIDLEKYPVLKFLILEDFHGLVQFAGDYGYQVNDAGYYSKCHLCADLRRFLVAKDDFAELEPKAFYSNLG
jgi:hypothetical protein